MRVLGPIQINSGWNVPGGPSGLQSGAVPPDQIRTGAARPINWSEEASQTPSCSEKRRDEGAGFTSLFSLAVSI